MLKPLAATGLLLALTLSGPVAHAHPGHDHPTGMRMWKDAEGVFEIEAAFLVAHGDRVQLHKHDGTRVWVPLSKLSGDDRAWVRRRIAEIHTLNQPSTTPDVPLAAEPSSRLPAPSRGTFPLALVAVVALVLLASLGLALKDRRAALVPALFVSVAVSAAVVLAVEAGGREQKAPPIFKHFEPFKNKLQLRWDETWFYVGSDGLPDHRMMVGIRAWQQQVPLPQPYTGKNAWQIPLRPKLAERPISAKNALYRGAIALAVNGVPIFNALNNRGEDAFLAGELDEYGGHCGRGDDYHYHIAPVHLEKVVGKGNPIAYALDGFPLYGYTDAAGKEPRDLDAFNGRMEMDGYRYYSTKKYPYINGGMRGVVTVRGDAIEPQPRDAPVRPALKPLRGAKITDFTRDDATKTVTLEYELRGATQAVKYTANADGSFTFVYTDANGKETRETYRRRDRGKGKGGPKKDKKD